MPKKRYYDKKMAKMEGEMMGKGYGMAMMPRNVIMKYYPKDGSYLPEYLQDGIGVVDKQKADDVRGTKKELSKTKF